MPRRVLFKQITGDLVVSAAADGVLDPGVKSDGDIVGHRIAVRIGAGLKRDRRTGAPARQIERVDCRHHPRWSGPG